MYISVLLLKELNVYALVASVFELGYHLVIALCFVLVFEPLIEKLPFQNKKLCCTLVYLVLFLCVIFIVVLFVPVIMNEWDRLSELMEIVFDMTQKESELVFSYESALSSTVELIQKFGHLIFSYLMAYFISLEYDEMTMFLCQWTSARHYFEWYESFKEHVFQYLKALMMDVCVLFFAQLVVLNLFDVSYSLSLALGLALLNIIPYFGSLLGQLLIFLIDYLTTGQFRIMLVVTVFVVQQIEANALQPVLFSRMMNIRPLYLFASLLFFGKVLGFAGILFAPVFAVAIQFTIQKTFEQNVKEKT